MTDILCAHSPEQSRNASLVLLAVALATVALYWNGLHGPFLFDDRLNLIGVQQWLDGEGSWTGTVFGMRDSISQRALSMASFTFTAWLGDGTAFSYKLGNLILHLFCAGLAWLLFGRMLALETPPPACAPWIATIAVSIWLVHPLHVSTVLYAVQRMAQLSTLFVLASLLSYLAARRAFQVGHRWQTRLHLFVSFPLLATLGVLSKQNAAVAPALCLVLELAYFQRPYRLARPFKAFYALFLGVPAIAAGLLLMLAPQRLLAGYAEWDFTLAQRLMSQTRALIDYSGMLLLPRTPRMGLYTDDFATSTGLLSPPTTLLSILALLALSGLAIRLRRQAPAVFAGWFFFLIAHGIESSFLPVELYYEHRNYLPSLGLFLALTAGMQLLASRLETKLANARALTILTTGFLLVLTFATLGRVQIWRSMDTIAEQATIGRPASLRAAETKALQIAGQGRFKEGIATLRPFVESNVPRNRLIASLDTLSIRCVMDASVTRHSLDKVLIDAMPKITVGEVLALRELQRIRYTTGCGALEEADIAAAAVALVDAANAQPDSAAPKVQMRVIAAVGLTRSGFPDLAWPHIHAAWEDSRDPVVGDIFIRISLQNSNVGAAEVALSQLEGVVRDRDTRGQHQLAELRAMIERHRHD